MFDLNVKFNISFYNCNVETSDIMELYKTLILFTPRTYQISPKSTKRMGSKNIYPEIEYRLSEPKMFRSIIEYYNYDVTPFISESVIMEKHPSTGIIVIRGSILNNNNNGYEKVNSILSKFVNTHSIISASIRSESEESWNEFTDLRNVSKYHTDMSKIKTFIPVKMVTPIADIEQFPGHTHSYDGIWFGCSYEMWFGKDYNNYIPLKHINSFADCAVKEVYENGTIRIKMFDDINAYNSDEAVSRQFAFRRHTKCDEMADYWHKRVKDLQREVNNESISIYEGKFEHGGVRLIKYYLDSNNNPTCRSEAVKVHIEERGTDGKNIFTETLPIDK